MIALAGDNIYMNWYSLVGPVDSQLDFDDDESFSAKYMKAMKSAISAGVKILCYCCKISPNGIHLDKKIKFSTVKK